MKKNGWRNYQKRKGNGAIWRINKFDLRQFAGKEKTLIDLGANHGEFGIELAQDFQSITAVEPFTEAPKLPKNMIWVKKGFKDYVSENTDTFDVVFSFAMTKQVKEKDNLEEDKIAIGHYNLTKQGGIMIYETQKLEDRPLNKIHVDKMLLEFREKYGQEIVSGNSRESGKRKYYVFKK